MKSAEDISTGSFYKERLPELLRRANRETLERIKSEFEFQSGYYFLSGSFIFWHKIDDNWYKIDDNMLKFVKQLNDLQAEKVYRMFYPVNHTATQSPASLNPKSSTRHGFFIEGIDVLYILSQKIEWNFIEKNYDATGAIEKYKDEHWRYLQLPTMNEDSGYRLKIIEDQIAKCAEKQDKICSLLLQLYLLYKTELNPEEFGKLTDDEQKEFYRVMQNPSHVEIKIDIPRSESSQPSSQIQACRYQEIKQTTGRPILGGLPAPSAFSIVEMAVVLAIIGILIAGVIITKGIVDKAKIVNAQTLTESSIVNDFSDNLILWHETSFFEKDIIVDSNSKVQTWVNRNPKIINNARATTDATCYTSASLCINQPQLIEDGELRIPFVRFAVNQLLKQNALSNLNKSFSTIFVVSDNSNNIFTLDKLWQSPEITKKYIKIIKNYSNIDQISIANAQIGSSSFAGDIFEIIAFNIKLSQEQIDQIKAYLITKYKL